MKARTFLYVRLTTPRGEFPAAAEGLDVRPFLRPCNA